MRSQHSRWNILCGNRVQTPWDSSVLCLNVGFDLWMEMIRKSLLVTLKIVMCKYKVPAAEPVCSLVNSHELMKSTKTADNFSHAVVKKLLESLQLWLICELLYHFNISKNIWDYSILLGILSLHLHCAAGGNQWKNFENKVYAWEQKTVWSSKLLFLMVCRERGMQF